MRGGWDNSIRVCARACVHCACNRCNACSVRWVGMVAAAAGTEEYRFRIHTSAMLGKHQVRTRMRLGANCIRFVFDARKSVQSPMSIRPFGR